MNTPTRKSVFTASSSLLLVAIVAMSASASQPQIRLVPPGHQDDYCLPQFGFSSFNIGGVGERVTHVRWGGLAAQLGLEPGDTILSMNGFRLNYHGSWNDALHQAVARGGWVQLTVRDVRTGRLARRQTFVGDGHVVGPITPKLHTTAHANLHRPHGHHHEHHFGRPIGPITPKSKHGGHHGKHGNDVEKTIKKIAKLFD
jgi:membrane-associated protease RseP (regulator of RpoE activity)